MSEERLSMVGNERASRVELGPRLELRVNDVTLAYELRGQGPVVLFLHGLGGSRGDWEPQVRALEARYRCLCVDLRGHGESGKPRGPVAMAALAEDVAALVRSLEVGAVHVVGLSLGGMVALQLAVDDAEIVRSLTLVNSGDEVIPRDPRTWLALQARLWATRLLGPAGLAERLAPRLFPRVEQAVLRERFLRHMAANSRHAYLATTRAILGWSVRARLAEVSCPVLVVSGDRDYTPVALKAELVERLPRARLAVVADSGHATPMDQPEAFNALLEGFLAQARPGRRAEVA